MRINPPTLFWILISAILAADRFLPLMRYEAPWLPWGGGALIALGAGISAAGKRHFRRAGTNVYTFESADLLVTGGIYGVTRNPMYIGLILIAAGAALVSGTLSACLLSAVFALVVRYWYIAYEEDSMHRKFGPKYEECCRNVGRWLGRFRRDAPLHGSNTDRRSAIPSATRPC